MKSNGLLALLLVFVLLLTPFENAADTGLATESPRSARGDFAVPSDAAPQGKAENDTLKIVAAVVIVIFILYLISHAADTGTG